MPKIENGILTATNAEILNTVRQYAPSDYQSRVPAVTQGNVADAIKALNAYTPDWNVFWSVLLNRIALTVVRQKSFTNPLGYLKRSSLRWGIRLLQDGMLMKRENLLFRKQKMGNLCLLHSWQVKKCVCASILVATIGGRWNLLFLMERLFIVAMVAIKNG